MNISGLSEQELHEIVNHPEQYEQDIVDLAQKRMSENYHIDLTTQLLRQQWYYTWKGRRIGPVSEAVILQKIHEHYISDKTLIWTQGMADWTPAIQTKFVTILHPPPDPSVPPPLLGKAINNIYVWFIAFAPIVASCIGILIFFGYNETHSGWITFGLNCLFVLLDERNIKSAGHEGPSYFWAFLIPVYLFKRSKKLKHDYSYFIVWWIALFFSFFIDMGYLFFLEECL